MTRWVKGIDKINKAMYVATAVMSKEASTINNPGAQYALNSYAFHSKQLTGTLQTFLPHGFDKSKIEHLFIETISTEAHHNIPLFQDTSDKIRKRVLISSTYATASKTKNIVKIF